MHAGDGNRRTFVRPGITQGRREQRSANRGREGAQGWGGLGAVVVVVDTVVVVDVVVLEVVVDLVVVDVVVVELPVVEIGTEGFGAGNELGDGTVVVVGSGPGRGTVVAVGAGVDPVGAAVGGVPGVRAAGGAGATSSTGARTVRVAGSGAATSAGEAFRLPGPPGRPPTERPEPVAGNTPGFVGARRDVVVEVTAAGPGPVEAVTAAGLAPLST